MADEPTVRVEPAGKSEGDWFSAPLSSSGLPEFVEGEFKHMVDTGDSPPEGEEEPDAPLGSGYWSEGDTPSDRERIIALNGHMVRVLEAIGKDRDDPGRLGSMLDRVASRLGGAD